MGANSERAESLYFYEGWRSCLDYLKVIGNMLDDDSAVSKTIAILTHSDIYKVGETESKRRYIQILLDEPLPKIPLELRGQND